MKLSILAVYLGLFLPFVASDTPIVDNKDAIGTSGDSKQSPVSLGEVLQAVNVLSKAGIDIDMDAVNWRRKNQEDEEVHLIESYAIVYMPGLNPGTLTSEELSFMDDAFLFSFNQVFKDTQFTGFNNHFVAQGESEDQDGPEDNDKKAGELRGRRRWGGWNVDWTCNRCGPGRRTVTLASALEQDTTLNQDELIHQWGLKYCTTLSESRFDVFHDVRDCSIELERPPVGADA